ncbi:hypothetical protein GCM10023194_17540 [Planotetraspora phitsanulokensis]|uniref:Uncharacterized protein n=1 Tax=Planotetraspora phitsanulokensis TaxID=575192 RepID=A0A8J3U9P8_9ACTN|nr:hypothetical protein Pph01_01180 [Planotetraspora phitsanulokensis]
MVIGPDRQVIGLIGALRRVVDGVHPSDELLEPASESLEFIGFAFGDETDDIVGQTRDADAGVLNDHTDPVSGGESGELGPRDGARLRTDRAFGFLGLLGLLNLRVLGLGRIRASAELLVQAGCGG